MNSTIASDTLPTSRTVEVNRATTVSATRLASRNRPFRPPMIVLVAALPAERLHGAHAVHGLHELHDDLRDRAPGVAVRVLRAPVEPRVTHASGTKPAITTRAERPVQPQHHDPDADHGEPGREQVVQALVQQRVDGLQVAGQPGDDLAGRVGLVERQRQHLGVPEDPPPQVDHDVLADPAGQPQEAVAQQRARHTARQVAQRAADQHARPARAAAPGMPSSSAAAISTGPSRPARFSPITSISASATARRCGRTSERSNRRDRACSFSPMAVVTSSRSSAATPRHASCSSGTSSLRLSGIGVHAISSDGSRSSKVDSRVTVFLVVRQQFVVLCRSP